MRLLIAAAAGENNMSIQLIQQYYAKVEKFIRYGGSRNETSIRKAFQDLLEQYARGKNLLLVPEIEFRTPRGHKVYPDGTLKDALRQDWGYWESKDEKDDLDAEIEVKFAKGYPSFNILFEDSRTAVLVQGGSEVMRADFENAAALDELITLFVSYERPEVREFHKAIEQFSQDVPDLARALREVIDEQFAVNADFNHALHEFLELCRKAINPAIEMADMREMIIQHILTEDIFMRVFDNAEFHRENIIARKLQEVAGVFYKGATRHNIENRIAPYYETINARASQISDHHEKQKFLKALYENFYKAYNPKAADRLGVIYTPDEIVRFMIESADHLVSKHFGKTLGDPYVEILDPATGTGTFITELIEYLPSSQLEKKYENEIHCNEVAILAYYIANLNIEFTYQQKTGRFKEFENICFVDTLDNVGFTRSGEQQLDFFGLIDENAERIGRQNTRKISVIIGNPPYNANQLNENENNKNRAYPAIDQRIKDTYIKHSTAQKTKLYDMYARFIRWASDRLNQDGIVAFVSNNSFLNARSYDGFRKMIAQEFNEIYIIDLKGDARTSGEQRRKEGGNVFNDQIRVGVAVYFLVRKKGAKGCRIHYNAIVDYATAHDKLAYLNENKFEDLRFQPIHPDKHHNWLDLSENNWDDFIPLASKETKLGSGREKQQAIFKLFSLGIATNRDEWVYDLDRQNLENKIHFFYDLFNAERERLVNSDQKIRINDFVDRTIKWTSELEDHLRRGTVLNFSPVLIRNSMYRPFVKMNNYYDKVIIHRTYQQTNIFPIGQSLSNKLICISGLSASKPFQCIATDLLPSLDFLEKTQCLPMYRYSESGERIDNLTDWGLAQFHKHYADKTITRQAVFHYVYAVLHHPAYREKYAQNLKRDFPRIPFYADFWQWEAWGKALMELHLNYEQAQPYPLQRSDADPQSLRKPVVPRLLARKDSGEIEVDTLTTLRGVPPQIWDYRLGTYSAVEWVLERYKEKTPKDPTIRERFNTYRFADYKETVIDLIRRVCTVSVETMKIIDSMPPETL
jgi:predicted helicase